MHIEPGVVDGAKMVLSYGTALAAAGLTLKAAVDVIKQVGISSLLGRSLITSLLVFIFFEVLPHQAVGVSEVHFILGSTLFLMFGAGAAAIGLASGLLIQGLFFAPFDLPQYGMNLTSLLLPLFAMSMVAKRIIPKGTAYVDLQYKQTLQLSLIYQGGIVAWVAFWAFYGQGFGAENLSSVASFGLAYMSVVLLEPLLDLAVLAGAKSVQGWKDSALFETRLYH
ncbi:energy-coupling factor ABC transporter permease [Marinomonas sp. THO17]|uniref:energy-coupling factor ABC transporter permease n=1 Tax=Marinomonas sp. THO17 TaxID=3149048 RepID=UPI00336BDD6F